MPQEFTATWVPWGCVGFSTEGPDGYLTVDDTADIDTRWERYVLPGPALSSVDCSGAGGSPTGVNGFCLTGDLSATQMMMVSLGGTQYAKIKISDATQLANGSATAFGSNSTGCITTKSAGGTTEVVFFLESHAYRYFTAIGTGASDTHTANASSAIYRKGGQGTPANVVVLLGKGTTSVENRVDFNILTGSATMGAAPAIVNKAILAEETTFTGYARDDDHWIVGTSRGPLYQDSRFDDEFRPLKATITNSVNTAHCAAMLEYNVYPVGLMIGLAQGTIHLSELTGESVGPEVITSNQSAFMGRTTAFCASERWGYGVEYNVRTGDRYLFAFRPRRIQDKHPYALSYYTLRKLSSACGAMIYTGTLGGRTQPTIWLGDGNNVKYFGEGLDPFMPLDTGPGFATSGTWRGTTAVGFQHTSSGHHNLYKRVRRVRFKTTNVSTTKTLTLSWTCDRTSGLGSRLLNSDAHSDGFQEITYDDPATAPTGLALKPQIVWASDSATTVPIITSEIEADYEVIDRSERWP